MMFTLKTPKTENGAKKSISPWALLQANTAVEKLIVGSTLVLLLFVIFGWMAYGGWQNSRRVTYVIPPGTSRQLEAGSPGVDFPDEIVMTVGIQDIIVIENQDDVVHTFGPFVVGPRSILTKRFTTPLVYEGACTFHQDEHMRLVVNAAPWDIYNY